MPDGIDIIGLRDTLDTRAGGGDAAPAPVPVPVPVPVPTVRGVGLDAARSLAILMVLVCHCSGFLLSWYGLRVPDHLAYAGGFGVTLFFVLSGFLIGRILIRLAAQGAGWRGWLVFMLRRWLRTLPVYGVWLAVLALCWPPYPLSPDHAALLRHALPFYATMTQNVAWPMVDNWFPVSWSLSVEEWFYLAFSLAFLAASRLVGSRRALGAVLPAFLALPAVMRVCLPMVSGDLHPDSGIVVMRLDSIAYGVLAAWVSMKPGLTPRRRWGMALAGLLLVAAAWAGALSPLESGLGRLAGAMTFALIALGFAAWMPCCAQPWTVPAWLRRLLTAISQRSYAVYLVHLTLLEWAGAYLVGRRHWPGWLALAIVLGATWLLATLSYCWLELPLLRRRPAQIVLPAPRPILVAAAAPALISMGAAVSVGSATVQTGGWSGGGGVAAGRRPRFRSGGGRKRRASVPAPAARPAG